MRYSLQSSKRYASTQSFIAYPKYQSMNYWKNQISFEKLNMDHSITMDEFNRLPDDIAKARMSIQVNHSQFLLQLLGNGFMPNTLLDSNQTLLHHAVLKGDLVKIDILLQNNAGL